MTTPLIEWTGGKVDKPGVWKGIPIDVYHGDPCIGPSVSSSGLRTIWQQSAAHYWAFSPYNPKRFTKPSSPAFDIGRAAHHWLLGEADFAKSFVIAPYDDFRTKEAREWRDAEQASGRTVLKSADMEAIVGMRDGLMRNPLVQAGILDGDVERSILWQDDETGIWLRSRPDVMPRDGGDVSDLKTTVSVRRDDIARSIADYGYHMQAALLRMGFRQLKIPFDTFTLIFVEKSPPFCTRVVTLKDHELDRGEKEIRAALRIFAEGMATGYWPGPDGDQEDAEYIEAPAWAQQRAEERLQAFAARPSIHSEAAE